jgi:hypothetical protein
VVDDGVEPGDVVRDLASDVANIYAGTDAAQEDSLVNFL